MLQLLRMYDWKNICIDHIEKKYFLPLNVVNLVNIDYIEGRNCPIEYYECKEYCVGGYFLLEPSPLNLMNVVNVLNVMYFYLFRKKLVLLNVMNVLNVTFLIEKITLLKF